jgi:phosphoenolpyruvate synthase/pyruvate phosphate dikinase
MEFLTDLVGLSSHGSIVARESGIPAVLGTGVATHPLHDGQRVTVDGDARTVMLMSCQSIKRRKNGSHCISRRAGKGT